MTERTLTTLALAAASAFALFVAAPAYACGPDCDHHKKVHAEGKDCGCPHHAEHHKADQKADEKAAPGKGDTKPAPATTPDKKAEAAAAGILLAADAPCKCEKGGKNCTCPKGKCKCANCHPEEKDKKKA